MRRVSGETDQRLATLGRSSALGPELAPGGTGVRETKGGSATGAEGDAGAAAGSTVAVSIPDAIEGFDLRKIGISGLEFFAQTLDVAVDRAIVHIDVLAIRRIHQLVAVFDVPRTMREGFEDEELGDRQLDGLAFPRAKVPRRVENQLAADDDRLAMGFLPLAGELAAPDQRPDALDQEPLRKWLPDVVVGPHSETEQLVDLVILRRQKDDRYVALPP